MHLSHFFTLLAFGALLVGCGPDARTTDEAGGPAVAVSDSSNMTPAERRRAELERRRAARPAITPATAIAASQFYLEDLQHGFEVAPLKQRLAQLDPEQLAAALNTKEKKLAFWINLYNAVVQDTLSKNPKLWDDRQAFFGMPIVTVAGKRLSLEDIEHGIIRGSQTKLGMGYIGKLTPGDYEKMMRVEDTDPRIHFVLNCGAKDCPPVYTLNPTTLDDDLNRITRAYLAKHSRYVPAENKVYTTSLFKWFKGDFRETDGVDDFLKRHGVVPPEAKDPDPEYTDYDWTLALGNFG